MNNVSLIGRLTADPELRHTPNGNATTRFNIAVDRNYVRQGEERQADFITIVAWQQRAELICKYFSKGQRIGISGQIRTGSYTDKDGNKRYTFEVWAENIDFCESKGGQNSNQGSYGNYQQNNSQQNSYQQSSRQEPAPANTAYVSGDTGDFTDIPADEDLPF